METGEGKTLTATLAAGTAALAGIPVHVICVNDYLTSRDAEAMGPVYEALGLTVGFVVHGQTPGERQAAYSCNVTYCDNKEIAFDYLRDSLTLGEMTDNLRLQAEYLYSDSMRIDRLLLRGLHFARCDEADSLLIDESRTPLIISGHGNGDEEEAFLRQGMSIAQRLSEGKDYTIDLDRTGSTSPMVDSIASGASRYPSAPSGRERSDGRRPSGKPSRRSTSFGPTSTIW